MGPGNDLGHDDPGLVLLELRRAAQVAHGVHLGGHPAFDLLGLGQEPAVEPMGNSTMSSNVVRSNAAVASTFDHEGSAAMSLSGRAFLLVWIGSLALHVTGLTAMFFLAFPFARREEPAAEAHMVQGSYLDIVEEKDFSWVHIRL